MKTKLLVLFVFLFASFCSRAEEPLSVDNVSRAITATKNIEKLIQQNPTWKLPEENFASFLDGNNLKKQIAQLKQTGAHQSVVNTAQAEGFKSLEDLHHVLTRTMAAVMSVEAQQQGFNYKAMLPLIEAQLTQLRGSVPEAVLVEQRKNLEQLKSVADALDGATSEDIAFAKANRAWMIEKIKENFGSSVMSFQ